MIVWRGCGLLALIIGAVINVGIEQLTDNFFLVPEGFKHYRDAHTWAWFVGMLLSAIACWVAGTALEKHALAKAQTVTDRETGQDLRLIGRDDMFWIPVKWWSVVYLALGVWFWVGK